MENIRWKASLSRLSKIIRVITVPPLMIAALLGILYVTGNGSFGGKNDFIMAFAGLVVLPLLSYPAFSVFGKKYTDQRKGQRKFAFIFSIVGYVCCFLYGLRFGTNTMRQIFYTYFFTVIILSLLNKVLQIRASGHAASSISPAVFSATYLKPEVTVLFCLLFAGSVWASLYLKRHKWQDILAGTGSMIASFFLAKALI